MSTHGGTSGAIKADRTETKAEALISRFRNQIDRLPRLRNELKQMEENLFGAKPQTGNQALPKAVNVNCIAGNFDDLADSLQSELDVIEGIVSRLREFA